MFHNDVMSTPPQKKTTADKYNNDQEWFKKCIDSYETQALYYERELHRKMEVYCNLDNDIIDQAEIERVFNPMGLNDAVFPATIKNYPISVPKIDLLQGEEINRKFDWTIRARNMDSESSDQTQAIQMFMEIAIDELTRKNYDEEEVQKRIHEFSKYIKYTWKDMNESTATKILQYLWRQQNLKHNFNKGFRDALVMAREIYRIDIEGDEPILKARDPRNVYVIKKGDSEKIEDAEAIIEITYEPLGRIIDTFYDYLKPEDIDALEKGQWRTNVNSENSGILGYNHKLPVIYSNLDFGNGPGFMDINQLQDYNYKLGLPYDSEGNVRVVRVRWTGRRMVGILTYFDDNGDKQTRLVSEYYKADKPLGETIKWIWVNEAYEGTKIADSRYLKMQPREVQMRHFDNKSKCFLGYVGTDYGKSLMARMEPYQYLYNVYMYRLELVLSKYKGPIYELDISKIPDDWEMDLWMYYADTLGWAVIDPMNEGKKGAATGKLAGSFNTTGKVLDPNIGNYIQQIVMMLQYIEKQLGQIAGVTEQRQGQVDNRETVGGVERAVAQSSHITEKWFFLHDETKRRAMNALLDTARQIWAKTKSKKLKFVMDDMSRQFLEFNGEDFASTEYDLFTTLSSKDNEIRDMIKQLAHAAIQNGNRMGLIIDVLRSDSITDMSRMIEASEEETMQRTEAAQKEINETNERISVIEEESKQKDRELKKYEIDTNKQLKLIELGIKSSESVGDIELVDDNSGEEEKNKLNRDKLNETVKIESRKIDETIRHNREMEIIAKRKPTQKSNK